MEARTLDGPQALVLSDFEVASPNEHDVVIEVRAAGINFFDILITQGQYQRRPKLPFAPGAEVSGVVVAVGSSVQEVAPGQRVMALLEDGGYASHAVIHASRVYAIPDELPFEEAAAMGIVYQTSYFGLVHRARVQDGETVLVHAAAGGVGLAAVQIGAALGARVFGTAGTDAKRDLAVENGATAAFSYRDDKWVSAIKDATEGRGADVIYDPVGGDAFDLSTKCIAFDGRLVVVGFASGRIPTLAMNRVLLKNIAVTGLHWGAYFEHDPAMISRAHTALMALYQAGKIAPRVTEVVPLADAPDALARMAARKTMGKLVLSP